MNKSQINIKTKADEKQEPKKVKLIKSYVFDERKNNKLKLYALVSMFVVITFALVFGKKTRAYLLERSEKNQIEKKAIIIEQRRQEIFESEQNQFVVPLNYNSTDLDHLGSEKEDDLSGEQEIEKQNKREQQNQEIQEVEITQIQSESNFKYPIVLVNGEVVCALKSKQDFDWVKKHLYKKQTPENQGIAYLRGFFEKVEILYQGSDSGTVSKEHALKALEEKTSIKVFTKQEKQFYIDFQTKYVSDETLDEGEQKIVQSGKKGIKTKTYEVLYVGLIKKKSSQVSETTTQEPVDEIIAVGKNKKTNKNQTQTQTIALSQKQSKEAFSQQKIEQNIPVEQEQETRNQSNTNEIFEPVPQPPPTMSDFQSPYPKKEIVFFPGSSVAMGENYPNIDTSKDKPVPNQGIKGPDEGSLKFAYPTQTTAITSQFGFRWGRMHYGTDFLGAEGDMVFASEEGTITAYTAEHSGYGLIVEIAHSNGYSSRYAHLSEIKASVGSVVKKGDVIGLVGKTGVVKGGAHLHFEIRQNGVPYNPTFYLG